MWRPRFLPLSSKVVGATTSIIALLLIGLVYFLGIRSERTGFVREVLDPGLKRIAQPVLNAFRGRPPVVPQLQLVLGDTLLDSLTAHYSASRAKGWLNPAGTDPIGHCIIDGRTMEAIIGLRSGPINTSEKKRLPFRVVLLHPDTVLGIQSFDLVPVSDATPLRNWLLSQALKDEGLPSFALVLVDMRLNDGDLGLYAIEERLDSITLARWGRGPGPVLRFDDNLRTAVERLGPRPRYPVDPLPQEDWLSAPVMIIQGMVRTDEAVGARDLRRALQQLDEFRGGRITAREVFDVPATARMFALCDMLGGQDATDWWNMCFLLDSLSGSLIALPQYASSFDTITSILALRDGHSVHFPALKSGFRDRLFGDPLFFREYMACLDTFSHKGRLERMLRRLSERYAVQERIVVSEYPQARPDASVFAHNRAVIDRTMHPPDLAHAYAQDVPGGIRALAIANVHALPIEITAFLAGADTIPLSPPLLLWPREADKPLVYMPSRITLPRGYEGSLILLAGIPGTSERHPVLVRAWSSFTAN